MLRHVFKKNAFAHVGAEQLISYALVSKQCAYYCYFPYSILFSETECKGM